MCYKLSIFFVLFLRIIFCNAQPVYFGGGNICGTQSWKLVFEDNFDGNELNKDNWVTYFPYTATGNDQCDYCRNSGPGGQVYLDTNVEVSDGLLKLITRKEKVTWYGQTQDYSSGMVFSRPAFKYGKWEISYKIPFGMSFWPAFWLFGNPGTEIDIFEFGTQKPYRVHCGIRKWREQKVAAGKGNPYDGVDYSKAFHKFAVEWEPFFITYKIDDEAVVKFCRFYDINTASIDYCCVEPGVYYQEAAYPEGEPNKLNVILNLLIGVDDGPYTDAPNVATKIPNQFEIDYVRIFQRDSTLVKMRAVN